MVSIPLEFLSILGLMILLSTPVAADENREGWTIITASAKTLEDALIDSLRTDSIFIQSHDEVLALPLDSIGLLIHHPPEVLSTRSYLLGLGCAAIGVAIFLGDVPKQPQPSEWSAVIYGTEFGGAMLLGAMTGFGLGYILDHSSASAGTIDLRGESRFRKFQIIEEFISRPSFNVRPVTNAYLR
jgi:hypothetical protein